MLEIMTFLPDSMQIPEVAMRSYRNGYERKDLAKLHLDPMGLLTKANVKKSGERIQKQRSQCGLLLTGRSMTLGNDERWNGEDFAIHYGVQDDLTANTWALRCHYDVRIRQMQFGHVPLSTIYSRVPAHKWPTGPDRLKLTQCLEFAAQNPLLGLDASHFDWIITIQGLQAPHIALGVPSTSPHAIDFVSRFWILEHRRHLWWLGSHPVYG